MREYKFRAVFHQKQKRKMTHTMRKERLYSELDNAVLGCTKWLIWDGAPGDVVEIVSIRNEKQMGYVKMRANGSLETSWEWEKVRGGVNCNLERVLKLVSKAV